jgi:hypothetical protein
MDVARQLRAKTGEPEALKPAGGDESLADQTAIWLTARMLMALQKEGDLDFNGGMDLEVLREFCLDMARLRRGDHHAERLKLQHARLEFEQRAAAARVLERFNRMEKQAATTSPSLKNSNEFAR